MTPLDWHWSDLVRAIKAARWAFYHADDLTLLKQELEQEYAGWDGMTRQQATRLRQWAAKRYLDDLPIK